MHDLRKIKKRVNVNTWNVLWKLHSKSQDHSLKLEGLNDQVGATITTADYFLNGQSEPQDYSDHQNLTENILGLRNSIQRNKKALDNHIAKTILDSTRISKKIDDFQSRKPSNALPTADIERLKKDISEELAKNQSLASGNVFNTMDLTNRVVALEKSQVNGWNRLDAIGKSVAIIKNRTDPNTEDLPENRAYELDRIR